MSMMFAGHGKNTCMVCVMWTCCFSANGPGFQVIQGFQVVDCSPFAKMCDLTAANVRNMKHFTGAAFIEFEDEEEAIQSTKIPVKVEGVTLEVKTLSRPFESTWPCCPASDTCSL